MAGEELPLYEQPSEDELKAALLVVVKKMTDKREEFQNIYNQLMRNEPRGAVVKWSFAAFLQSYFAENI